MLEPRMFLGLNTSVKQNIAFVSENEILYPVGNVIVLHNFTTKSQRYITLPNAEKNISIISYSSKGNYLAVAVKGDDVGEKPKIYVYCLETLKRKITLGIPFEINAQEIMCLTFTHDSNYIAALTAGPDYIMYYYNWKNGKIESQTRANNPPSIPGPVTDMAINPRDATIAVFVGTNLFRLVSMSENVWRQYGFQKAQNFSILSVCWLTDDRVLAGCKDGKILMIQSGDLNGIYDVNEVAEIQIVATSDSKKDQLKTLNRTFSKQTSTKRLLEKKEAHIRCCTAIQTGFLYSKKSGEVIYFEKTSKTSYKKSTTFIIKQDINIAHVDYASLYAINFIGTSANDNILSCTTNRFQIYWKSLRGHENDVVEFEVYEEPLHHGPVSGLSTCLWKPIFMTCGQYDNSVRIWNYLTTKLLLNQTFTETVTSLSLHPTGLYALIGFSDKVRYFLVLIHKLQTYREFGIAGCRTLSFSNNGHLFAAECEHCILVYSSITFHKITCFRGHYQEITSLQWSHNDLILYSSSIDGAIYEWDIEKGSRLSDIVLQDMIIKGLVALTDDRVVCIGADGRIIEIRNNKVNTSQKLNHENASSFSRITLLENAGSLKLVLSCGNGVIITLSYPIREEEPEFETFSMHNCSLTQFHVLQGGHSFVSADIDGNICIWDVKTNTENEKSSDSFFAEILINMNELYEKNQNLEHLNARIAEMIAEHSFEILRKDNFYTARIKEIEQNSTQQIQTLKKRIKVMDREHSMELNRVHLDITQMKQQHTSQIEQLESHFNGKLLFEFQKYDDLRQEMEKMKDEHRRQLQHVQKIREGEHELHRLKSQNEIVNLQQKLRQLQNTLAEEKQNFETQFQRMKEKHEQNETSLKMSHKTIIEQNETANVALKTELGITKKKLTMFQKEKEEFKIIRSADKLEIENLRQKLDQNAHYIAALKIEMEGFEQRLAEERACTTKLKKRATELINVNNDLKDEVSRLKNVIQEHCHQHIAKEDEIYKLKSKIKTDEEEITRLKTKILQVTSRLRCTEKLISESRGEILSTKTQIANLKRDIVLLNECLLDKNNLKQQVKVNLFLFREPYIQPNAPQILMWN